MNVLTVLLRKHLIEARWTLGISTAAFFGLSWLTAWMAMRAEKLIDLGEIGPANRRYGIFRALGGSAMDYSTTAMEVCWWNHPLIVLTVLAWAIGRGAGAVAGEIERGTIDITLSRPVSRSNYLLSQVLFAVLGLVVMALALIAGSQVGSLVHTLKSPPTVLTLLKPSLIVVAAGMSIFGYTLPFSAVDVVRWRPMLASAAITLAGLVALSLAPQFPDYQKVLENLSIFQFYAPVTVAIKGDPLAYNTAVLTVIFLAGTGLSFFLLAGRDIPSNS